MKETIYTIPINEALEEAIAAGNNPRDCFCPICRLHDKLENDTLEYILGGAMMEPDVRVRTNEQGFCQLHLGRMASMRKALSLALMLQTHLQTVRDKPSLKLLGEESCFLCNRIGGFLEKYYENILYLWEAEPEFRQKLNDVPYICLKHCTGLARTAKKNLHRKKAPIFLKEMETRVTRSAGRMEESVSTFCKSFDHRFAGMELGDAKNASERAARYLGGDPFELRQER